MANNASSSFYSIDTKGSCFICLNSLKNDSSIHNLSSGLPISAVYSFQKLSNYLNVDLQKIFNVSTPILCTDALEHTEIYVSLCRECALHLNNFIDTHNQLESLQKQMVSNLRSINGIMREADRDLQRVKDYQQKLVASSPLEVIQIGIANKLRQEVKDKCAHKTIKKVPSLHPLPKPMSTATSTATRSCISLPPARFKTAPYFNSLRSSTATTPVLPYLENISKRPVARRQFRAGGVRMPTPVTIAKASVCLPPPVIKPTPSLTNDEVVVVDLDDSDTETAPEQHEANGEEKSELVIKSVSGANGLVITAASSKSTITKENTPPRPPRPPAPPPPHVFNEITISPVIFGSVNSTAFGPPPLLPASRPEPFNSTEQQKSSLNEIDSFLESLLGPLPDLSSSSNSGILPSSYNSTIGIGNETRIVSNFTMLENGRCQCLQCGKIMNSTSMESHKLIHLNSKPIKCIYCPHRCRNTTNLKMHVLCSHRAEMLISFKNEHLSLENYKIIVKALFQRIIIKKDDSEVSGRICWQCKYCGKDYKNKPDLDCHLPQVHSDLLGKELQELQKGFKIPTSPAPVFVEEQQISKPTYQMSQRQQGPKNCGGLLPPPQYQPRQFHSNSMASTSASLNVPVKCRLCGKFCSGKNVLRRHMFLFHSAITNNNAGKSGIINNSKEVTKKTYTILSCQFCNKKFRFSHSIRVHILVAHRFQMFRKYFPSGTSETEIDSVVNNVLAECKIVAPGTYGCNFCSKTFSKKDYDVSLPRNHTLLKHFNEFVQRLKTTITSPTSSVSGTSPTSDKIGKRKSPPEPQHDEESSLPEIPIEGESILGFPSPEKEIKNEESGFAILPD